MVDDNPDFQDEVMSLSGQVTVPVIIWEDGRVEVGFEGEVG